jgi:Phage portal protein, SPP1 Gp6-like
MSSNDYSTNPTDAQKVNTTSTADKQMFPDAESTDRLASYVYFEKLFFGKHFEAFNMKISSGEYNETYSKLKFVMVNFAGMISKICADMLFSEDIRIKTADGKNQDFIDALVYENKLRQTFYESALSNSYNGDAIFKVRVGKRNPNDAKSTVIIEDITPRIYFPQIDPFNVKADPAKTELSWIFTKDKRDYLRREIHSPGKIENKVNIMDGKYVAGEVPLATLGIEGLEPVQDTKIQSSLIVHVPNWKAGNRHFGVSDYADLDSLFYAIDNRMTKVDNILDKHSDPILMVPPGVLDEEGRVRKKSLGVIEIGEGESGKPEYVVWDASLENAFKEIEKLVEFIYMVGEVSPDVLGMGEGKADSGKALKFKLMRTIAKVTRKKMYYDWAIKQVMWVAQEMAVAWGVDVDGVKVEGKPSEILIDWKDGLPIDIGEQIETEQKALDAGITTEKDAIMRVYELDEKEAEEKSKEIDEIAKAKMPQIPGMGMNKFDQTKPPVKTTPPPKE